MKGLVLLLSAVVVLGIAACSDGSGEATSTGPLAFDQRVVTEEDASDSEPDPVETGVTVSTPDEFIDQLGDSFINPSPEDVAALKSAGFVQAIHSSLMAPSAAASNISTADLPACEGSSGTPHSAAISAR